MKNIVSHIERFLPWEIMKKSYQKLCTFAVFGLLFASYACFPALLTGNQQKAIPDDITPPTRIDGVRTSSPSGWLHIYQDNWSAGGFAGTGTPGDPYIIEDLEINGEDSYSGILVEFSNAYFTIRNCTFDNIGALDSGQAGVKLVNTTHGIVRNNTFSTNFGGNYGVLLVNSSQFNSLEENIIQGFYVGIYLQNECSNNSIDGNALRGNIYAGIFSNCTITSKYNDENFFTNNIIENNNGAGIYLNRSRNCVISSNFIFNNTGNGIYCRTGDYVNISTNIILNNSQNGISLYLSPYFNITMNHITNQTSDGIEINTGCNYGWILNNRVTFNKASGISVSGCLFCQLSKNFVLNNSWWGIALVFSGGSSYARYTLVTKNFADGNGWSNAYDSWQNWMSGYNNWNSSTAGNFWGDYAGTDADNDGIGDALYNITDSPPAADFMPIVGNPFHNGSGIIINGSAMQGPTNWTYVASRFWCDGSGTSVDPYIISDLIINGWNKTRGIYVLNSIAPFRVENCTVFNASATFPENYGIELYNTDNGTLKDNRIFNNGFYGGPNNASGIRIYSCNNLTIIQNHIYNNTGAGLNLASSFYLNLTDNIIEEQHWDDGLYVSQIRNCTLSGNIIRNNGELGNANDHGIEFRQSESNNLTGNEFSSNAAYGMYIWSSNKWNLFTRNNFSRQAGGNTITEASSGNDNEWNDTACGNYWYGYTGPDDDDDGIGDNERLIPGSSPAHYDYKPIYNDGFNKSAISIDDQAANNWAWATTRIWCSGSGVSDNPYLIKDIVINAKFASSGILIQNSTAYFVLQNVIVQNVSTGGICAGIYLLNTTNGIINNSKILNNLGYGIVLSSSANKTQVSLNALSNNSAGGIYVESAGNNTIFNNNFTQNGGHGVLFESFSNDNELYTNLINNNTGDGVKIQSSSLRNRVGTNIIENNTNYGVSIDGSSSDNQIHVNNTFRANLINALDDGTGNTWHNGSLGNYWADYAGFDTNGNEIGETPYNITGLSPSQDLYPIWTIADVVAPVITIIEPYPSFLFGIPAPQFNITIEEYILEEAWYTLDGGLSNFTITQFNGTINQTAWESRPNGTLLVRFYARDNATLIGFKDISVQLDKIAPSITVQNPIANNHYGANAPTIEISVTDANLVSIWYNLDGGTNVTIGTQAQINQIWWDALPERTVTIIIYANDTMGNVASYSIAVVKDLAVDDPFPWWLQAIVAGLISTLVGMFLRYGVNASRSRRLLLAKMQENIDKIENLGIYLESNMDPIDWEKFKNFWNMYQNREISRKELLVRGQKAMGKRFTKLLSDQEKVRDIKKPQKGLQAGEKPAGSAASLMKTLSVEKGSTPPPSQPEIPLKQTDMQETIQQIDAHIEEMYNIVKTLDEKFARGEVSQELFLKKKTELAEKIGELQGKKEQLSEKK